MEYGRLPSKEKTTMSVPEMSRILGLGKTEGYWLIKKNYFKTVRACNRFRIYIDSFEDWYAGQWRYWKVEGPPPGSKFPEYISKQEIMKSLGISEGSYSYIVYEKPRLKTFQKDGITCILRADFEKWLRSQSYYKKVKEAKGDEHGIDSQTEE